MRKGLLISALALALVSLPADARTFYENNMNVISSALGCSAFKRSAIFSEPKLPFHALSILSVHWSVDNAAEIQNVHSVSAVGFKTDKISVGHSTAEGIGVMKIVMSTEFFSRLCFFNGFLEREFTKRLEKDC
ncbi:MAG: hypothetical protein OER97_05510 [Gammaproteobacteria bacterium]|nr:hypothetical protein [Gammaproteobacteria bacterium]